MGISFYTLLMFTYVLEQYNYYTQLFQRLHNIFKVVKYNFLNCVVLSMITYDVLYWVYIYKQFFEFG